MSIRLGNNRYSADPDDAGAPSHLINAFQLMLLGEFRGVQNGSRRDRRRFRRYGPVTKMAIVHTAARLILLTALKHRHRGRCTHICMGPAHKPGNQ